MNYFYNELLIVWLKKIGLSLSDVMNSNIENCYEYTRILREKVLDKISIKSFNEITLKILMSLPFISYINSEKKYVYETENRDSQKINIDILLQPVKDKSESAFVLN